jgi:hypothetical protein
MFEEPSELPSERSFTPEDRAREQADLFRMHAELAAVFEGHRKFEAEIRADLKAERARDIQKTMARLERARLAELPVLPEAVSADAARLLCLPKEDASVSTNDYHIYRRPGETIILRWLAGAEVETFYERLQAHFDAALNQFRPEERAALEWKQDPATLLYLKALDAIELKMADRYVREPVRQHKRYILSTQTADEMDILHLCDYLMGVEAREVVGQASAPPEEPTERDRAWFFKLFSLRGMDEQIERMCFFTYLQKSDETEW